MATLHYKSAWSTTMRTVLGLLRFRFCLHVGLSAMSSSREVVLRVVSLDVVEMAMEQT